MNENKAVPNIRFNDFENKWEKKKLNQIVKKITRKNSKLQTSLSLTISAERGIINQNLFFNRQIASRDMSNYFLIKQGEFAYNKSYSKSAPFGTIKRLNRYNQGALSSLYIVFCPTKVNSDYLVSYFDSSYWYKQLSMISTEGVRNHGLLNVSPNDFFDMNLSIPCDDKEQQKIGDFFSKLDKLLDLQQQKINKLELLKKALLQKLFPKHDTKIPELRFKGYEKDWSVKKLGEITKYVKGYAFQSQSYTKHGVRIIRATDISNHNIQKEKSSSIFLSKDMAKLYLKYIIHKKDIIITTVGVNMGNAIYVYEEQYSLLNQNLVKISTIDGFDSLFVYFQLKQPHYLNYISRIERGNAQTSIAINDLWNYSFKVPKIGEQQKIGNLLSKVDQLIELENQKLQNFQQVKKCLLQNMFVE